MKDGERGIIGMALHRLYAALAQVIPHFDRLVIARRDEVRPIRPGVKVDIVDPLVVRIHRKVGMRRPEGPHLDGAIETGGRERVGVFWVKRDVHDVVRMALVYLCVQEEKGNVRIPVSARHKRKGKTDLNTLPLLIPIPSLDCHIITPRQHNTRRWMHGKTPDIIRMGLKREDFFMRVVVEDAQLKVVRPRDEPVFARDKLDAADGDVGHFKRLY